MAFINQQVSQDALSSLNIFATQNRLGHQADYRLAFREPGLAIGKIQGGDALFESTPLQRRLVPGELDHRQRVHGKATENCVSWQFCATHCALG